jgi:hypothetical protein
MPIPQANRERIEKFIAISEKVRSSKFRRDVDGKTIGWHLNFQAGQGIQQTISGFDEEDFRSVLMDLRKLLLKKDGVLFPEICDLIKANTTDPTIITEIEDCKNAYNKLMADPQVTMILNGTPEKASEVLSNWLYGHYIHEEKDKEEYLAKLGPAAPLHRYNFVIAITQLIDLSILISIRARKVLGI